MEPKVLDFKIFRRNFESLPYDTRSILEKLCKEYKKQTLGEQAGLHRAISLISDAYYIKATPDEVISYLDTMGAI